MNAVNLDDLSVDDLEALLAEKREQAHRRFGVRRALERLLLAAELAAVIGLVLVAVAAYAQLQTLNQEVARARSAQPASTVAPLAQATLPAASQPPSASLPDRFKGLVKPLIPVALPTPGPQAATRIVIPAIGVEALVVEGDDWEALKKGAGHHAGSANPGERGNMVISAHNDVFGEIFRYLGDLKTGDEVFVYTQNAKFIYVVKGKRVVEPTEVGVMAPTTEPTLTLITCHPYLVDTQRIVVFAQLAK